MRKLTKTTLVFALSFVAMFSCVMGLMLNGKTVKAESITVTQVERATDITTVPFEMSNVQIRLDLEDTKENGIRFVADAKGEALSDVVYGMVITAYKDADLTTENLFGENAKYTFVREEAGDGLSYAVKYELGADKVAELGGYLIVTLKDFSEEQIDKGLTAVCYLKNINEEGKLVYDVKAGEISTSMQEVALSAIDKTQGATKVALLDTYVGEADEEAYKAFAGYYTDAYKFEYNEETKEATATITTVGVYDTKGHDKETKATYKLYKNGTFVINTDQIIFGTYNDGVKVNGLAITKVDIDTLRVAMGGDGTDVGNKRYTFEATFHGSSNRLTFYPFDSVGATYGENGDMFTTGFKFRWDLIPITETFGKVYTTELNPASNNYYYGLALAEIYYTYNQSNDLMYLRMSTNPVTTKYGATVPYNHFVDATMCTSYIVSSNTYPYVAGYDTSTLYAKFGGDVVGNMYKDESATLKLFGESEIYKTVKAGTAIFNDGVNEINATYDVVRIDDTKGLFFIDMNETPAFEKVNDKRFARGTYTIDGDDINIKFTYNGVDYSFDYVAPVEVEQSVYNAFAGNYTDTYVFNADKTVTRRDLSSYKSTTGTYNFAKTTWVSNSGYKPYNGDAYKEHPAYGLVAKYAVDYVAYTNYVHETETGSYILWDNGVIEITFNNDTVVGTYEDGKFIIDEVETVKVNTDKLYTDLAKNTYKDANGYDTKDLKFTKNASATFGKYKGQGFANSWQFEYQIIPITETYGKIEVFCISTSETGLQNLATIYFLKGSNYIDKDGNVVTLETATKTTNATFFDFGKRAAEVYYVYDPVNGTFSLRVSSGVGTNRALRPAYNHFTDYTVGGVKVTDDVFTTLAGTYGDGTNTLVLSGLTDLKRGTKAGNTVESGGFKGGYGTWKGATITYSLIKLNENSGKIFFHMANTPTTWNTGTANTFCQGDYVIDGSNITITFTYAGTTYTVTYTA